MPAAQTCLKKALQEDPDYKAAQLLLKSIYRVKRAKDAANELFKGGDYQVLRPRASSHLRLPKACQHKTCDD